MSKVFSLLLCLVTVAVSTQAFARLNWIKDAKIESVYQGRSDVGDYILLDVRFSGGTTTQCATSNNYKKVGYWRSDFATVYHGELYKSAALALSTGKKVDFLVEESKCNSNHGALLYGIRIHD